MAPAAGPQQFAKVGTRNAMVIAVCSVSVFLDPVRRHVGIGIGSAAPTPVRAPAAGQFAEEEADWDGRSALPDAVLRRFGDLVAAAASTIDDVRGTASYRRRALSVLGRRCLLWCWEAFRA
jgi:CO/xanthine dehydrogenase FAD-binding subunit